MVHVFKDRTFAIEIKCSPVSAMIKKAAGIEAGSGTPNLKKVGKITMKQIETIAAEKGKEMTGHSVAALSRTIAGTARSMGVDVIG